MFKRTVSPEDLARLKREREEADRRYNELLSALDATKRQSRDIPHPPPPSDETQLPTLHQRWDVLQPPPPLEGWRGRLKAVIWRLVQPFFDRQRSFNAALVDHLARNAAIQRETARSVSSVLAVLQEELEALRSFQWNLMAYALQITPYVDTKDHEVAALMRRINEDVGEFATESVERLERRTLGLAGALDGVADELQKRWESMVARDRRFSSQVEELRTAVAALQQQVASARAQFEAAGPAVSRTEKVSGTKAGGRTEGAPSAQRPSTGSGRPELVEGRPAPEEYTTSHTYVGFENAFRGPEEEIQARFVDYLPWFEGATDVLDAGCGRGEFLALLKEHGIRAVGVDVNRGMIEVCRARGLDAHVGDVVSFLRDRPAASLGGLFAAQVVEHLEPDYLLELLAQAFRTLRPGSRIVLETLNPACWFAFFDAYIRDITHVRPLHPDTLKYLVTASGFQRAELRYRSPYPDDGKLQAVPADRDAAPDDRLAGAIRTMNRNVETLNGLLFSHLDYAAIAERP